MAPNFQPPFEQEHEQVNSRIVNSRGGVQVVERRAAALPPAVIVSALERPLLGGILPTEVGQYVTVRGYDVSPLTGPDGAIVVYCAAGRGWCNLDSRRLTVSPGEVVVISSDTPCSYGADDGDPWSIYWVRVQGALTRECLRTLGVSNERPLLRVGTNTRLEGLFVELFDVLEESSADDSLLRGSSIFQHMISIFLRTQRTRCSTASGAIQRVAASIDFMKCNLARSLDIALLSDLAKVSPSHYSTLFKRQTGFSPVEYLIRLRVQAASELLDNTSYDIKTIAAKLGYKDPLYFSRVFVGVKGVAPSEYRRCLRSSTNGEPSAAKSGIHRHAEPRSGAPGQVQAQERIDEGRTKVEA
jgi:AraC family transcriptional regulator, arabinose operon regulatory protein